MANILKDGRTYLDDKNNIYPSAYMVIERAVSQANPVGVTFDLNIYKDSDSRNSGFKRIFGTQISMSPNNISTYIGSPQTAQPTEIPAEFLKKWVYNYLGTELPTIPSITWSDWKSDVIGGVPT